MKIEKDAVIYIILFALISFEAYRDASLKTDFEKRINAVENIVWNLTVERGKTNGRVDALEMKIDSVRLYLQSNK